MADTRPEVFISVDIEAAGPNPSRYSMISIGACLVDHPAREFYIELKPVTADFDESALAVSGLSMEKLAEDGVEPLEAMRRFEEWVLAEVGAERRAVLTAFNAGFDWMFVNDYFHRYLGRNPFGVSALDIKAYYLGMAGGTWAATSMQSLSSRFLGDRQLTHNALADAQDQAELFRALRKTRERG